MGSKICDTCRKKLGKLSEVPTLGLKSILSPSIPSDSSSDSEVIKEDKYDSLQFVNQCLEDMDETLSPNGSYEPRNIQRGNLKL